jgi:hypothetical protein
MARRFLLLVMVVMLAGVLFTTDASAAQQWYTCRVEMAGPGWGAIYIQLSDNSAAFTKKWFSVPADTKKEILAVALTAMNSGMKVLINTDLNLSGYPPIYAFYLAQ